MLPKSAALLVLVMLVGCAPPPPQPKPTDSKFFTTVYSYSGNGQRLKQKGKSGSLIKTVEAGEQLAVIRRDGQGGAGGTVTIYSGGRVTYDDGVKVECPKMTVEETESHSITSVACN